MELGYHTPYEIINNNINGEVTKANLPTGKMVLLGLMAGAFIAFGGSVSSVAVHGILDVGLARTLAGTIFPVGLMLVVLVGGELFTGNCLMLMAFLDRKITGQRLLRNLIIVYFSNLLGALLIDTLLFFSGQLDLGSGAVGAYAIKVAVGKTTILPFKAVCSGILCNILVCLAILMASSAKDVTGKIFAIFFPIWAFVIGGFEHCVANMFYVPLGLLAASRPEYVQKAAELYGITAEQCEALTVLSSLPDFFFVTIGNILGGMIFVGLIFYRVHKTKWHELH
ncbi:MAG: formate/nitrite transporter family protein [bacterium]|nr:formate/nitrite transporter family protein [bacterium]